MRSTYGHRYGAIEGPAAPRVGRVTCLLCGLKRLGRVVKGARRFRPIPGGAFHARATCPGGSVASPRILALAAKVGRECARAAIEQLGKDDRAEDLVTTRADYEALDAEVGSKGFDFANHRRADVQKAFEDAYRACVRS